MSEKLSRREFVGGVASLGLAAAVPSAAAAQGKNKSQVAKGRPLMVSTWKQGKPANEKAAEVLAAGGSLLDALEKGINIVELDPDIMSVGYGAYPNEDGVVSLDAVIMDGATHRAGAVGALEKIATPISVARRVMEKTYHTFLAGEHALRFALEEGFEPEIEQGLQALGHKTRRRASLGHADCIEVDPLTHGFRAVADVTRGGGEAVAF